jgi:hypothetical protein
MADFILSARTMNLDGLQGVLVTLFLSCALVKPGDMQKKTGH